ncbi:30S ribosomal protein S6 [Segnochrobactraceae bacterium EtOH-i3]
MPLYEHVLLARQDISSQQVDALVEQFKAVIEAGGGKVTKVESWGLKALAYRVKKNRKAHYVLLNLDAPPAAVAEMERQEGLNEDILRILTVRVDELEDGQSVMLQKRDRDDRRHRDDDGPGGGRRFGGGDRFGGRERGDRGDRGDRGERRPRRDEEATAEA